MNRGLRASQKVTGIPVFLRRHPYLSTVGWLQCSWNFELHKVIPQAQMRALQVGL